MKRIGINEIIRERTPALVGVAYRKQLLPDISARLCNVVVTLVDSLIAARFIGLNAISAIALLSPIFLFDNFLHCLFGSGTSPVIIRYKSRGQGKEAKRAFATILLCELLSFSVISAVMIVLIRPVLGLFTSDTALINDAVIYVLPSICTMPLAEAGLIFERGMKTDGRPGFFAFRSVLTNVLNIILSILAITVFDGGIFGIAAASCLSTLLGYCWSASHFFTKNCTIRPDFSVIRCPAEMKQYMKEELDIGRVYALDAALDTGATTLINKAFILAGGTAGLAAIGICSNVFRIAQAIPGAVNNAANDLGNMFFADKDYVGTTYVLRKGLAVILTFSAALGILIGLFPDVIAWAYEVTDPEVYDALMICLRILLIQSVCNWLTNLFSTFMVIFRHTKTAEKLTVFSNIVFALTALPGLLGSSFPVLLAVISSGSFLTAAVEGIITLKTYRIFAGKRTGEIKTCSYTLTEETAGEISRRICDILPKKIAGKASLLTEECNKLILFVNRNGKKPVLVDLRVNVDETECVITIVDTGLIFDPLHSLTAGKLPDEYVISRQILKGFSPKASYSRIVNLNISHLVIGLNICHDCDQ